MRGLLIKMASKVSGELPDGAQSQTFADVIPVLLTGAILIGYAALAVVPIFI